MTRTAAQSHGASAEYSVEQSPLGRIVVAPDVPEGYRLFYTTRDFDGSVGDRLKQFVGAELFTCHQVHGKTITKAGMACDTCDALWSDAPNTALAIKVADCLPVTLIDPDRGVMANIHSGWRGAVQRIVDAAVDAIGATPSTIAWLGPSIRVCCFEVGEEVAEQFPTVDRTYSKPHVDLAKFTTQLLQARGVGTIYDSGLCTKCGDLFHSYRHRDKGRNLAIVCRTTS
jgi:purine-nucleoside/S-methyl-5'-thioadenosine phosphorylase / adenosine deaminase